MSFSSQSGHVGIKTQTTPDVYADAGTGGIFFPVRSSGLGGNRELLVLDPEIGGSRDITGAALGAINFSGEYEFYPRPGRSLLTILKLVLGSTTPTGTTPVYTHNFATTSTLPWFSIEEKIGNGFEVFRYTDAKMNTLHLEADANGFLMGSFGVVARKQLAGATATASPTFDAAPQILAHKITIAFNGVTLPAKSFSMDINNNLEDDDFRLGSLFLGDVPEKRRDVTFGVTLRPQDKDLWRMAMYGSAAATSPGGVVTIDDLVVTMETYEDIPTSTPPNPFVLSVTAPNAIIAPFGLQPSGDDVIEHDAEIRAIRPPGASDILTVTLKNGTATAS